jgi:hypothetical protein
MSGSQVQAAAVADVALERPALRGTLHLAAAVAVVFATPWLLLVADSPTGYVGAAVFAAFVALHESRTKPPL